MVIFDAKVGKSLIFAKLFTIRIHTLKSTYYHIINVFSQYKTRVVTFIVVPNTSPRRRPGC